MKAEGSNYRDGADKVNIINSNKNAKEDSQFS